jgi:hypothetical protein
MPNESIWTLERSKFIRLKCHYLVLRDQVQFSNIYGYDRLIRGFGFLNSDFGITKP